MAGVKMLVASEAWTQVQQFARDAKARGIPVYTLVRPVRNYITNVTEKLIERKSEEGKTQITHIRRGEILQLWELLKKHGRAPKPEAMPSFAPAILCAALPDYVEHSSKNELLLRQGIGTDDTLTEDLVSIVKQNIDSTTREALICARVGQGVFRAQVLRLWGQCCSVTRSITLDAIKASHIKPWRESTDEERLDANNGLPLVASLDALFDVGLISFEESGELIVSSSLNTTERRIFALGVKSLAKRPTSKTSEYLAYHRNYVFRK